jgi:channel protein (hemolysin III family)
VPDPILLADPFAALSHLLAAPAALVLGVWLVRHTAADRAQRTAVALFAASVVLLLSSSGVYHLVTPGGGARVVLRHLDHAAIWILIAGTFTPVHVLLLRGAWRYGMLGAIWTFALVGLTLESIWLEHVPGWLTFLFYLVLGWLGAISCWRIARDRGFASVRGVLAGGVAYSIGGALDAIGHPVLIPGVVGAHELFHVAVVAGIAFHFRFVRDACAGRFPLLTAENARHAALSPAPSAVRLDRPAYAEASPKYLRSIAS